LEYPFEVSSVKQEGIHERENHVQTRAMLDETSKSVSPAVAVDEMGIAISTIRDETFALAFCVTGRGP
jgi:hypothetical protein